MVAKDIMRY